MAGEQEKSKRFKNLAEFYPYYKSEHQQTVSMSVLLLVHHSAAAALLLLFAMPVNHFNQP
jgi:hypothetical protein